MIPEIGHFSLIIGLVFAALLTVFPSIGVARKDNFLISYAWTFSYAMFFFILLAVVLLGYSFATDDFSVKYVVEHSNSQLPIFFKVAAIWGGHEGSLLFWVFSISTWSAAVAFFSKSLEKAFTARVLAILGAITVGFGSFMIYTSNPFLRLVGAEIPMDGIDLNPMLQDVGLIFHPPMLYLGYVGFSVSFAFAIAALLSGKLDSAWVRWSRPWTLMAWVMLTGGISLGSWWAYYELGWGGWWFWDPVENASFMPWLIGTALLHSVIVTEKRGNFRNWTILLSIFAFSLSLLGTFIVRSGVLTSVHSFAADPSRGMFILILLFIAVGGSLLAFALGAKELKTVNKFDIISKESMLMLCNIFITTATFTILLGTLYPLIIDALGKGKISVGPPYYNSVFVPIVTIMFIFMGMGPILRWKKARDKDLKVLIIPAIISIISGISFPIVMGKFNIWVMFGISSTTWIVLTTLLALYLNVKEEDKGGFNFKKLEFSTMGMIVAHLGIAMSVFGATMVSNYTIEKSVRMGPGITATLGDYEFKYIETKEVKGPNYTAKEAQIEFYKDGKQIGLLKPDRRDYNVRSMGMAEAAIDWGFTRDIYVTMGDSLGNADYAVRLNYKPYVRWIWIGSVFMMLAGLLSLSDRRYRRKFKNKG